jgi:hypothetical protein
MELTEKEIKFIEFFDNLTKNPESKKKALELTLSGEKERTWVKVYTKFPIEPHLETILFKSDIDEDSILNELDTLVNGKTHKVP